MTEAATEPERRIESETGSGKRRREHYDVSGDKVIGKIKELIREGNIRHIVIKNEEGRTLIEVPLTLGVAGAVLAPVWAAIGAIAALVKNCSIEIERDGGEDED